MNSTFPLTPELLFTLNTALLREKMRSMDSLSPWLWNCEINFQNPQSTSQLVTNDPFYYTSFELERMTGCELTPPPVSNNHLFSNISHIFQNQSPIQEKSQIDKVEPIGATNLPEKAQTIQRIEPSGLFKQSKARQQEQEEKKITYPDNGEQLFDSDQVSKINDQQPQPLSTILLEDDF